MKVTTRELKNYGIPTRLAKKITKAINEKGNWGENRLKKLNEEIISKMCLKKENTNLIRWIYSEEDYEAFPYNCDVVYKDPKGDLWVRYRDLYALIPAEVDPEIY